MSTPDLNRLEKFIRELPHEIEWALADLEQEVISQATALSQGDVSSAALAAMDHPFATRHGSPQMALLPLNRQSGLLQRSWFSTGIQPRGDGLGFTVYNTAPYAGFLEHGTRVMFARPLPDAVLLKVQVKVEKRLARAVQNAARG